MGTASKAKERLLRDRRRTQEAQSTIESVQSESLYHLTCWEMARKRIEVLNAQVFMLSRECYDSEAKLKQAQANLERGD